MILYGDSRSGNCYKIQLLCAHLGHAVEWREVDVNSGATRAPWFLALNPFGKLPVLELAPGQWLPESNAASCALAEGTPWLPADRVDRARVLAWLFWEQYSHEPVIATVRYWMTLSPTPDAHTADIARCRPGGERALDTLDAHLTEHDWLVGPQPTIADIALYAYTHVAHEAAYDLAARPAVTAWLARMAALDGHRPMQAPRPLWQPA